MKQITENTIRHTPNEGAGNWEGREFSTRQPCSLPGNKHDSERLTLTVRNVFNSETKQVDRIHIDAVIEYSYPSGRSKWASSTMDLTPHEARQLALHLRNLADVAEINGAD